MSFRSFLYQDFDQTPPASLVGSVDGLANLGAEGGAPRHREIEIVRREGFEAGRTHGFAEGQQAALEEAEVRLARDLPDLLASLGGAAADMARLKRACEHDAFLLASAALRQILPLVAERGLGQEAAALVGEVVASVPAPTIEVRASPGTREAIERRCGGLPSGVSLITDPDVPEGGVQCAWAKGQARFDGAAVGEAILAILDRRLGKIDQTSATPAAIEPGRPQQED